MNRVIEAGLMVEEIMGVVHNLRKKAAYDLTLAPISNELRRKGYRILGEGCFGVALRHPQGFVIKISVTEDDGYPEFAKYVHRNPHPGCVDIFYVYEEEGGLFFSAMPEYDDYYSDTALFSEVVGGICEEFYGHTSWHEYLIEHNAIDALDAMNNVVAKLTKVARQDTHAANFLRCKETGKFLVSDPVSTLYASVDPATALYGYVEMEQVELDFDDMFEHQFPRLKYTMPKVRKTNDEIRKLADEASGLLRVLQGGAAAGMAVIDIPKMDFGQLERVAAAHWGVPAAWKEQGVCND